MKKAVSLLFALIILAFASVPAMALPSPTASKDYKVIIHNTDGGTGTYTKEVDEDGRHVTVVAHPKKGYEFVKWKIKGKYDLEDGDLTDEELTVLMNSDLEFTPIFKKVGSKSTESKTPVKSNGSPTSPKTGDTSVFFIFTGIALLLAAMTAVTVKLAKDRK